MRREREGMAAGPAGCSVVQVSDTKMTDQSGRVAEEAFMRAGAEGQLLRWSCIEGGDGLQPYRLLPCSHRPA